MAKGGYLGGGTIIGPRTPDWFGQGEPGNSPDSGPPAKTERNGTPIGEKRSRNQRRKDARARADGNATAGRIVRLEPPPLTTVDENRIAKLKIAIIGGQTQLVRVRDQLDRDRRELREVLAKYGIPLDHYPECESPKL